jgi:acyl-coenzyme A synthetase/AMP-(fatty) acid ligase
MATARSVSSIPVPSNHPLYILYTSGTTGTEVLKLITAVKLKQHSQVNQKALSEIQEVMQWHCSGA